MPNAPDEYYRESRQDDGDGDQDAPLPGNCAQTQLSRSKKMPRRTTSGRAARTPANSPEEAWRQEWCQKPPLPQLWEYLEMVPTANLIGIGSTPRTNTLPLACRALAEINARRENGMEVDPEVPYPTTDELFQDLQAIIMEAASRLLKSECSLPQEERDAAWKEMKRVRDVDEDE